MRTITPNTHYCQIWYVQDSMLKAIKKANKFMETAESVATNFKHLEDGQVFISIVYKVYPNGNN